MYGDAILPGVVAAVLWLICNVIAPLAMILGLPELFPDEEEPAGTRFAFLSPIDETAITLLLYGLAGIVSLVVVTLSGPRGAQ